MGHTRNNYKLGMYEIIVILLLIIGILCFDFIKLTNSYNNVIFLSIQIKLKINKHNIIPSKSPV